MKQRKIKDVKRENNGMKKWKMYWKKDVIENWRMQWEKWKVKWRNTKCNERNENVIKM